MAPKTRVPSPYRHALKEFAAACRDATGLAELLEHVAGLLRGRFSEAQRPAQELAQRTREVCRLLERIARTKEEARAAWGELSPREREGLPTVEELLEVEDWSTAETAEGI
jgi:hypothetical protein